MVFRVRIQQVVSMIVALSVVGALVVSSAPVQADTAPPSSKTLETVSADPLPTVQVDGMVWDQVLVGNKVYAVGTFAEARPAGVALGGKGTVKRANILAFDIRTGVLDTVFVHSITAKNPSKKVVAAVTASPDGTRLYVGGTFDAVDGQSRSNFAAFDLKTNKLLKGFDGTSNSVMALAATNERVYVGGGFSKAAGQSRSNLAAYLANGKLDTKWKADVTGPRGSRVAALTVASKQNNLIIAGAFTQIAGSTYLSSGAVKLDTAKKVKWASQSSSYPIRMQISKPAPGKELTYSSMGFTSASYDGKQAYLTAFSYLQGATGSGTFEGRAAVNPSNGAILWRNACKGDSYDAVPVGGILYSVGHPHECSAIGGYPDMYPQLQPTQHVTAETTASTKNIFKEYHYSELLHWYPKFTVGNKSGSVQAGWTIVGNKDYLSIGGEFPAVGGVAQQGLVRFTTTAKAPNKVGPNPYRHAGYGVSAAPANKKKESTVTVYTTSDNDNVKLTYTLYRLDGTKLATKTVTANWWESKSWTYVDKDVPVGTSLQYKLVVKDSFGNKRTYNDTTLIDDMDSRITYTGSGWSAHRKRKDASPDFGRTIHRASKNGDSMVMTFTGTSITMFNESNNYSGVIDVSIDGGTPTRINLNLNHPSKYRKYQYVSYVRSGLKPGKHTITVKKVSGKYIYVDAFKVR